MHLETKTLMENWMIKHIYNLKQENNKYYLHFCMTSRVFGWNNYFICLASHKFRHFFESNLKNFLQIICFNLRQKMIVYKEKYHYLPNEIWIHTGKNKIANTARAILPWSSFDWLIDVYTKFTGFSGINYPFWQKQRKQNTCNF